MTGFVYALLTLLPWALVLLAWRHRGRLAGMDVERLWWLLLLVGLMCRLPVLGHAGFASDTGTYMAWALKLSDPQAPLRLYEPGYFADYPPVFMYALALAGTLARAWDWVGQPGFLVLIKLPSLLADLCMASVLRRMLRDRWGAERAMLAAGLIWLNPAMLFDGALWGQTESLLALLAVLIWRSVSQGRPVQAAAWLATAVALKPQGALYAGVLGLAWLVAATPRVLLRQALAGLAVFAIWWLPFAWRLPADAVLSLYRNTAANYDFLAVNACNLWTLLGFNWRADAGWGVPLQPLALGVTTTLLVWLGLRLGWCWRHTADARARADQTAWALVAATVIFFLLAPRMHERYLLPLVPLTLLLGSASLALRSHAVWTLLGLANVALVYHGFIDAPGSVPADGGAMRGVSALLLAASVWTLLHARTRLLVAEVATTPEPEPESEARIGRRLTHPAWAMIAGLTVLAGLLGAWRVGTSQYPQTGLQVQGHMTQLMGCQRPVQWHEWVLFTGAGEGEVEVADPDGKTLFRSGKLSGWYATHRLRLAGVPPAQAYRLTLRGVDWRLNEWLMRDASGRELPCQVSGWARLQDEGDAARVALRPESLSLPMFDEVYHARTGHELLHGRPVYETTHPPLGKWLIGQGISAAGMTPFGWRITGVMAGALTVGLLAWGGWWLTGSLTGLTLAGVLGLTEFSRWVLSRYATLDVLAGAAILLVLLAMAHAARRPMPWRLSWPLASAGIALGGGIATKWSVLYLGMGLALTFIVSLAWGWARTRPWQEAARDVLATGLCLGVLPVIVYLLSYQPFLAALPTAPDLLSWAGLQAVWQAQGDMFRYHSELTATHPFASAAWTWPLNLHPLWVYQGDEADGDMRRIVLLGSPVLWWGGLLALCWLIRDVWRRPAAVSLALLGAFLACYLPWLAVHRATFIYHYYPNALLLVWILVWGWGRAGRSGVMAWGVMTLAVIAFAAFLPVLSAWPVSPGWSQALRWLPGWWML